MSPYMSSTGWMSTYMLKRPNKSQVISSLLGHGVELCCAQRGTLGWGYSLECRCSSAIWLPGGWDSLLDVGGGVPGGVVSDKLSLAHAGAVPVGHGVLWRRGWRRRLWQSQPWKFWSLCCRTGEQCFRTNPDVLALSRFSRHWPGGTGRGQGKPGQGKLSSAGQVRLNWRQCTKLDITWLHQYKRKTFYPGRVKSRFKQFYFGPILMAVITLMVILTNWL